MEEETKNVEQSDLSPLDQLREAWERMPHDERMDAFIRLPRSDAEDLFLNFSPIDQAEIIAQLPSLQKRSWIRLLAPDDAADLMQVLAIELRYEALALLDEQTRREVTALLAYEEDVAGGLMNSRYFRLRPEMSVDEAIRYLRAQARTTSETIYYAYVLDHEQKLLGAISFRELFIAQPQKIVKDVMQTDLVTIPEEMDQEEVSRRFSQHSLHALPVIDKEGQMKGIVTVDDVVDVVKEEATEDMQKLGGVAALDAPYLQTSLPAMIRKRAGWLTILFVGEMFTATAMGFYEKQIEQTLALALFIPLIISSGGNSGSQASTLIIRAIALGEVQLRDWWKILLRELSSGFFLGLILGSIGLLRIIFWPTRDALYGEHYFLIGTAVACSVGGVVLWGAICGSMLPLILSRLGFDPASASAPFVATLVDVTGLVIYFTVASSILHGVLL